MRKSYGVQFLLIVVLVMGGLMFNSEPVLAQTEQITLTTYYPSPFGVYRQLRARQMAVGPTWANPAVAPFDPDGGICGVGQLCHGEFFVETAMAIGARDIVSTGGLQAELMVNDAVAGDSGGIIIGATGGGGTSDYSVVEFHDNTFNTLNTWRLAYRIAAYSDPNQARDMVLFYRDGTGAWQHAMTWDSVNRFVGIGTTNPNRSQLHIHSSTSQATLTLTGVGTLGSNDTYSGLYLGGSQADPWLNTWWVAHMYSPGTQWNNDFVIGLSRNYPGNVMAALLIDNVTGNVGIGTADPQVKLDVNGKIQSQSTSDTDPGTTVVTKDYISTGAIAAGCEASTTYACMGCWGGATCPSVIGGTATCPAGTTARRMVAGTICIKN